MLSNLPCDLVDEILVRVPAKSLIRFRTTCKRWNALFGDHIFSQRHFGNATKESMGILISDLRIFVVTCGLRRFGCYDVNLCKLSMNDKLIGIRHCDGLLLCILLNRKLMVWNPCLNQTKLLITPEFSRNPEFAIGCDKKSGGCRYKILAFIKYENVEMYDFTSNSWRVLNAKIDFYLIGNSVSLKGNSYWVAMKKTAEGFVLSFDYSTEMFGCMSSLPFLVCSAREHLSLSVKNDRISILYRRSPGDVTEIWMTGSVIDGQQVSWSKLMTIDANKLGIWLRAPCFFIHDEENKVVVVSERTATNDRVCVIEEERYTEAYVEDINQYSRLFFTVMFPAWFIFAKEILVDLVWTFLYFIFHSRLS